MNDSGKERKCRWGENPKLQVFWFILVELQSKHFSNKQIYFFFLTGKKYEDEIILEEGLWKWCIVGKFGVGFWGSLVSFKVCNCEFQSSFQRTILQFRILCINRSSEYFTPKFPCSASFPIGESCGSFLELINGKMKINEDTYLDQLLIIFVIKVSWQ